MESKTNYTIVGVIVLILVAGLLSAALWLSVGFNQKSYHLYVVYLREAAAGLALDAPVKFNGVQVGFVKNIQLNNQDPRQVEITLSIEEGIPITTSTSATLISQGITGVAQVGLSASSADLTPLEKLPGERYPVIPAKPSLLNQLDSILKDVAQSVKKVSTQAQRVFNDENARSIRETLANIDKFSKVIATNSNNINQSLSNVNVFLGNMAKVSKDLPEIVQNLKTGVVKFNQLSTSLSQTSSHVSKTMVSGKNALDKISEQTLPPIVVLLRRLNALVANLEKTADEIRQNPSVVIRGTKPPKPGPGES